MIVKRDITRKGVGGRLKIPDEYVCSMCGYVFLSGETVNVFCPECGSSFVAKEIGLDEYLDEEPFLLTRIQ